MFGIPDIKDHGQLAGLADDDHPQYLLIDGTRAMTGTLTSQDIVPDTINRALGNNTYPFRVGRSRQFVNLGANSTYNIQSAPFGGFISGRQAGTGTTSHACNGGAYPAVAAIGAAYAVAGSNAQIDALSGGSVAIGSAASFAAGADCQVRSTGYASLAFGYAYGQGTSTITSQGPGSFAAGYLDSQSTGTTRILSSGRGSLVNGAIVQTLNATQAEIQSTSAGSMVVGNITHSAPTQAFMRAQGEGSFVNGTLVCAGASTGVTEMSARVSGPGSFVQGRATCQGGYAAKMLSAAQGAFVQGQAAASGTNGYALMQANGVGSFCQGNTTTFFNNTTARIRSIGTGSFAQGAVSGLFPTGIGEVLADGDGSFAQGYVLATVSSAYIQATGKGSFAHGAAYTGGSVLATGPGSFTVAYVSSGQTADAQALNSVQFGIGVNAQADSMQIGNAGIRFKGTTGAPTTPQNGDMWMNNNYLYLRSNNNVFKFVGGSPAPTNL